MHAADLNRVVYYSKDDLAGSSHLTKGESILRSSTKSNYTDINDVLELYNIKKYIDNDLFLNSWTPEDIIAFKQKVNEFGKIVGQFMSTIDDNNVLQQYSLTVREYIDSFWELVNNQAIFKRISKVNFSTILTDEPHLIYTILTHRSIVDQYNSELKTFLLTYPKSAEILLSIYEVKQEFRTKQKYLPKSLTIEDKETIISNYLESSNVNLNYVGLIQNIRNKTDFKVSDKIRLKAKRLQKLETEQFFSENNGMKYGVSISFIDNATKIKDGYMDNLVANYSYSLDYIKQHNDNYSLFENFKILFEYLDIQNRITLVSKRGQMGVMEMLMGVHSQNEYRVGIVFQLSEMTSQAQIVAYDKVVSDLNKSLEDILHYVYTSKFQEIYGYADNAHLSIPSATNSFFEKVRLLAPEFESVLKQFKLFVEDGYIDFELLQISSSPSAIKDIPSLNQKKYIYFNEDNEIIVGCANLFFSDQTGLSYVEPFQNKNYASFFDLLENEVVYFDNYEDYQKPKIDYLIEKGFISIDEKGVIQITNPERLIILKDLYFNEVASFHHYPINFQEEVNRMAADNIVFFESTLFSKPEQSYLNYFLNKSEFTNGLDLRNSYLHGTQAKPDEVQKHQYAYFTYLRLLFMTLLKIEDDLLISQETTPNLN
ncbi:hypothetical protein [Adhaeribacter terreus]|uniref:DUF4209 domain-containing protein n=1 Tax=Adhaeribacter terreus TaxID=529703 RepID=A0ABW0ECH3_9BACT